MAPLPYERESLMFTQVNGAEKKQKSPAETVEKGVLMGSNSEPFDRYFPLGHLLLGMRVRKLCKDTERGGRVFCAATWRSYRQIQRA